LKIEVYVNTDITKKKYTNTLLKSEKVVYNNYNELMFYYRRIEISKKEDDL